MVGSFTGSLLLLLLLLLPLEVALLHKCRVLLPELLAVVSHRAVPDLRVAHGVKRGAERVHLGCDSIDIWGVIQ